MKKPIVVVGSINMDLVVAADRIPVPGETIAGMHFRVFPGGKGANQAVAVARLGWPVYFIGKVGNDAFGRDLRISLESSNVNTDAMTEIEGSSGVASITTDASGQNSIVVVPGANNSLLAGDVEANEHLISSAALVLCQLEIPLEAVLCVSQLCNRDAVPLMLDPAPGRPLPTELLDGITWITPNESETRHLLAIGLGDDLPSGEAVLAKRVLALGPRNVVLKLGANGCYVDSRDSEDGFHTDAYPVEAVDSTAAGDAFNGAFATALVRGCDRRSAVRFASASAALSVTRCGAQPSMPTAEEVEDFLQQRSFLPAAALREGSEETKGRFS